MCECMAHRTSVQQISVWLGRFADSRFPIRSEATWQQLRELHPLLGERTLGMPGEAIEQVELAAKYSGYVARQAAQVEKFQRLEPLAIPAHFDCAAVFQLRAEARQMPWHMCRANRFTPSFIPHCHVGPSYGTACFERACRRMPSSSVATTTRCRT